MEKTQALFTMHEMVVALNGSPITKHICLDSDPKICKSANDHVIKIKHDLDDNSLKIIESILKNRNLKIEKIEDMLVIH
jgi:hypothetical protein